MSVVVLVLKQVINKNSLGRLVLKCQHRQVFIPGSDSPPAFSLQLRYVINEAAVVMSYLKCCWSSRETNKGNNG